MSGNSNSPFACLGWLYNTNAMLVVGLLLTQTLSGRLSAEELGVQVPEGFEVTLFADDDLAHDIYSMTIDSQGRVVVSGKGYVKILVDQNGDGVADSAKTFVDGPATGAQGMYFFGPDLICAGDAGLIRYRDRNGDDRADGEPDVFLKVKAGGEHDLHAIRKGPDGWWYVIAGNMAGVSDSYVTLETSPIKKPQAGTVMRFRPDLSAGEVITDGLRNAYDFDFNSMGDLFTFDSDGERDISLPWYRPTRVFHMLTGADCGWKSRSWKRPQWFFDMPPALAELGRGSPTGVECYQHTRFPLKYQNALFVLDWTYGRVFALPMSQNGSTWSTQPVEFMSAVGQHGFAPTDVCVGKDGALYVCVGGRGTRGGVYRIASTAKQSEADLWGVLALNTTEEKVDLCLKAPQPLASWSRRIWEPVVKELTSEPFISAATDKSRTRGERIRAIEILTEKFNGLDGDMCSMLSVDTDQQIRARVAWSIGRSHPDEPNFRALEPYLSDQDPIVVRTALEALLGAKAELYDRIIAQLGTQLGSRDRYVRQTMMRLMSRATPETAHKIAQVGYKIGWHSAIPVAGGIALRTDGYTDYPIEIALRILKAEHAAPLKVEAARILQMGLGDVGPGGYGELDPVFDGYATHVDLSKHGDRINEVRTTLAQLYPSGDDQLDWELERIIAIVQPDSDQLLTDVLKKVNANSHPVLDIHRLITAARIPVARTPEQRTAIGDGLVHLETKIKAFKLRQDSNWNDRILELYYALLERDDQLPIALLENPDFGQPSHVQFISGFPANRFDDAIKAFVTQIKKSSDYEWNTDVVFLLSQSPRDLERDMIRSKFSDFALRNSVAMSLATEPEERDRRIFVEALEAAPTDILKECVNALGLLPPSNDAYENVMLVRTLRKLPPEGDELQPRDQIVELLRRNLRESFNYRAGQENAPQTAAITAWTEKVRTLYPEEFQKQTNTSKASIGQLKRMLAVVDWTQGDATRGLALFKTRGCVQCHGRGGALGPDLVGVAGRFSRDDLFTAIAFPDQDVSPRYQTTQIATTSGHVRTGLIVYESVDGLVLRDANNQTYRIETNEIEVRQRMNKSLMPSGLLKELQPTDYADLYAYLRSLGSQTSAAQTASAKE